MPDKKSNSFLYGLTTGIAITALLGFLATTIASSLKTEKGQAEPTQVADTNNNVAQDDEPAEPTPLKVDFEIKDSDHIRGDKNAPLTIVEYSDFQCSYCAKFHTTLNKALEEYKGKIKVIYRHFPLDFHPFAEKAAEASECASDQNKFWEYADEIYKNQASFSEDYFKKAAKDIKLDTNKFNTCLASGKYKDKVAADTEEGANYGISGTPGSFLNGEELGGAIPYEQLKAEIDDLLK